MSPPSVTIILPVYDEADAIEEVLSTVCGQDYQGPMEIVVADGGSTDGTRQIVKRWADRDGRIRLVDNPRKRQSSGFNVAARAAIGEYLVRADGHSIYAPDYVRRSIETLLESGAVAAGGPMRPQGQSPFGRAVAAAMASPLTIGSGRFHHATEREAVDTVYLGAFHRQGFLDIGGFRTFPSGAAEDADLYHRWRRTGATVVLEPSIRSTYVPRDHPSDLWRQYFRYGCGKAEMLWANGRLPSLRPLAPAFLVLGLFLTAALWALIGWAWPFLLILGTWLLVIGIVAVRAPASAWRVLVAGGIMHLAYGLGVWWAFLRGPRRVKRGLEAPPF